MLLRDNDPAPSGSQGISVELGSLEQIALGRLGGVEDIANTVAFLASADAAYITGETIHVNGGMY